VVGSGNFVVTDALVRSGARFVAARHEGGAAMMADAFGRLTGRVPALSLHQGCGLTNALTGITEAAKSRTPLVVLAADTPASQQTSNFWIDQAAVLRGLGAEVEVTGSPETAVADTVRAYRRALHERRTVVLNLPLDVQGAELPGDLPAVGLPELVLPGPSAAAVTRLADAVTAARRPVLVAGRGARGAAGSVRRLAERAGALLATSAVGRGLFAGDDWSVDVMGGFASPTAAALIADADLIVAFGAGLNRWTTRDGSLIGASTTVVQVDLDAFALGVHRPVDVGVVGDAAAVADAVADELDRRAWTAEGYRTAEVRERIAAGVPWRTVPYADTGDGDHIDPRTLTLELDDLLPRERVVVTDGGNFAGYPAMFLSVPDNDGYVLPLAFQSIGLALGAAIGAAIARPDRLTVAGIGDGGFLMSLVELDTAVRLRLPMVLVVYNDDAYGAEVHHFAGAGVDLGTVTFPDTDIAAIARGFGCAGLTVRKPADLAGVTDWLAGPRTGPLVVDAKTTSFPSWVLEHTFTQE
jgi:thiamine pyrophosphate-dependent acetolactate synthase large subunit-like protein